MSSHVAYNSLTKLLNKMGSLPSAGFDENLIGHKAIKVRLL